MIGTTELILIASVALLLFGGKKLPELMRGMGQGIKSFKEGLNSPVEEKDREPENSVKTEVAEDSSKKSATENTLKETTTESSSKTATARSTSKVAAVDTPKAATAEDS